MSLPAPLAHAFPHLVAEIDADRPLISAALVDVQVTEITADTIRCNVTTSHSYDLLTSASQHDYLNTVACKHLKLPNASFIFYNDLFYNDRPTTAEEDMGELPLPAPAPPATTNGTPQRNALNFTDRSKLSEWMKLPENREYVEKQTDAEAAIRATNAIQISITAGNITGMRNTLGITKFKPEKPADPPADVDLIALQKQLTAQGQKIEAMKIEASTTREAVNQLITHVRFYQQLLAHNADRLSPLPAAAEFQDLKPLIPLSIPASATAA